MLTADRFVERPLDWFQVYEKNPRRHEHAIAPMVEAIKAFGFRVPVQARSDGTLVDGHLRLKAATQLGFEKIPVVLVDDMSEAQIRAFRVSVNRMSELASWDFDLLLPELEGLQLELNDSELDSIGFTLEDLHNDAVTYQITRMPIDYLKPHPRNYRKHPDDQIEHLCQNIRENGMYRNIVVASDGTILAGHGVAEACRKLNMSTVPVLQLSLDPNDTRAIKVLTADNEIEHLGVDDDRLLANLLKEVLDDGGLIGTGYDEKMLANLLMVTRPESEIEDFNAAAEWVGMPDYQEEEKTFKATIHMKTKEDAEALLEHLGVKPTFKQGHTVTFWWPPKGREDPGSIQFQG